MVINVLFPLIKIVITFYILEHLRSIY